MLHYKFGINENATEREVLELAIKLPDETENFISLLTEAEDVSV